MPTKLASRLERVEMSFDAIVRRGFDSRLSRSCLVALIALGAGGTTSWKSHAQLPLARTEVAAARHGNEIVVVGGYVPSGDTSAQADAFSPSANRWRRLPDLPQAVNHAMAATWRGRIVVAGGYVARQQPSDRVFVLENDRWRELARLAEPRAAAGAAIIGDTLYVAGGIGRNGLATAALALALRTGKVRTIPAPTKREHLAVTAAAGRIFALAGRTAGIDTNLRTLESWRPGARGWTRLPPVPRSRGGTGATAIGKTLVSVGGEEPAGTIATVYAYNVKTRRWRRLPNLPTPRHGLGVVAFNGRVYVLAGGPRPGLTTSGAVESLPVTG
jgi:Kelch motif protein/galactose oxidase-like protein